MKKKPTVQNEAICKNCYFYKEVSKGAGFCKRYPPIVLDMEEDGSVLSTFPVVTDTSESCGEFAHGPKVVN